MSWLTKLFGTAFTNKTAEINSLKEWYYAVSSDGTVRQVVLSLPATSVVETDFSTVILPADKFPVLAMNSWCVGFCKIDSQYVMMLRTGRFASVVKNSGITVALSFCHMPSYPVLLATVRIESNDLVGQVRSVFSHVPALSYPIAEWVCGLNSYDRELVPAVLATNPFRVILAEDSPSRNCVYLPNGQICESSLPHAICEFQLNTDQEARQVMQEQWTSLIKYDSTIPSYKRNFQTAANVELIRIMPLDKDPIMDRNKYRI